MYKPPRRVHTSTGRFPFSQRSPSKRRAFLGVFNITKSFGRHDKCQRPRISLQIKRCQPITPPIIRRKHRELPIFCPSAQRRFFHVRGRAGKEGRPRAGQLRQLTRRCKPSCACPRQHRTGCPSGSRGASSSRGRSRCSQPGRSRSRRRRKPCCRSRQPGR